jgi:acyl-CoA synthetase (AMP-forming)/AMP-acid ligase II
MTDLYEPWHAASLVEILRHRAEHQGDQLAYAFLENGERQSHTLTYRELDQRARAIAAQLVWKSSRRSLAVCTPA